MKRFLCLVLLFLVVPVSQAEENAIPGVIPKIKWSDLHGVKVVVDSSDKSVVDYLGPLLDGEDSHYKLRVDSYFVVSYRQQGLPGQKLSLDDAMAGKEIDRSKFHYLECGRAIDNNAGKRLNSEAAGTVASQMSGGAPIGVGAVVTGVASVTAALLTDSKKVLPCDEEVSVCPLSSYFCVWTKLVASNFHLYKDDELVGEFYKMTYRSERGLDPKDTVMQHLSEIKKLIQG